MLAVEAIADQVVAKVVVRADIRVVKRMDLFIVWEKVTRVIIEHIAHMTSIVMNAIN